MKAAAEAVFVHLRWREAGRGGARGRSEGIQAGAVRLVCGWAGRLRGV